ncbi:hypothetical protein TCAL_06616 [Tigriopus californicus]|uniref:N-formylglutamate amidohydrolase n=1 Tax=Tigriopus californicus TaxID=6832 RepID=A0A553PLU6_TIGCA|nr:uncharacterized protein LOC131891043 [Tigriopus californicus]TRY78650.1 hypothetical protein TCAL_06616 [Tigriopus californicus]|eukprot:TCALIF_06616-PA protein Name:"Protein of unknown function" AED:0.00 eAED:0.00 QI:429/1/1/1/0.66/0.75/4/58/306
MKNFLYLLLVAMFSRSGSSCQSRRDDPSKALNLVEFHSGTLPIILTVPHGGEIRHPDILNRMNGCRGTDGTCQFLKDPSCASTTECKVVNFQDMSTIDIAWTVANQIEDTLGGRPFMVISHLHRMKLDPNRELDEAAQGDEIATTAYLDFHNLINDTRASIGTGILFDLHGQGHKQNSTEVGYRISTSELNAGIVAAENSSIRALAERLNLPGNELIQGAQSFGALLEGQGFRALPSPRQPIPGEDKYYRGGYITNVHGSLNGGQVDAIQLEMPSEWRYEGTLDQRNVFAKAVGEAIAEYYELHYL